jgi:DNA polymerase-3 subunit beta
VVEVDTDRKELAGALSALKGAVANRPGIPALTGVLLEGDGAGDATLTATDLEVTTTARIGTGGAGIRALVPYKLLAETVKSATGERIELERVDGHIRVAGASLRLLPEEDFPTIAEPGELVGTVDAAELVAAIQAVEPATSRDEARPVLTGCLLEVPEAGAKSAPTLVATDSYRLHVAELGNGWTRPGRYIIPGRTLAYVAKRISKRPAFVRVAVRCTDSAIMFELGAVRVTVRLIEGEFPNWRQLVPDTEYAEQDDERVTLTYDVAELEGALKAAGPFCTGTSPVRFRIGPYGVGLSASSPDLGEWSALLAQADRTGPELVVAFNPFYLAGSVKAAGAGARMVLRDGLKPAAIISADGRIKALVMPVRLSTPVNDSPTWRPGPGNPYGVPGVGTDAPHEPSAAERAAGKTVEDPPEDPTGAGEPEPVEHHEPEPEWERCAHGYGPGECHVDTCPNVAPAAAAISAAYGVSTEPEPASEPAGNGGEAWSELATLGEVDGVKVRLITGPDGGPWVDVRRFVTSRRYNGPTRKGLAVKATAAARLAELLADAAAASETE